MAIMKMKRLRLIAMAEDRETILRTLQRMGCVEVSEAGVEPRRREMPLGGSCSSTCGTKCPGWMPVGWSGPGRSGERRSELWPR